MYVGTSCAADMLLGSRSVKNGKRIHAEAKAHNYKEKWIAVHGTGEKELQAIASGIRTHYCPATVWKGKILIGKEMEING